MPLPEDATRLNLYFPDKDHVELIKKAAELDGRTLSNFIDHHMTKKAKQLIRYAEQKAKET